MGENQKPGLYDFYTNMKPIKMDIPNYSSFTPSNQNQTSSQTTPQFDPNEGKEKAFYNYMQNGNFRNAKKAQRKFNEFWDSDENYRRQNFETDQELNRLMSESQQRMAKGSYFDDISEQSQIQDAIDYHNAGWTMGNDGNWTQPADQELKWNQIAANKLGKGNTMDDVRKFQEEYNNIHGGNLILDGKWGQKTQYAWDKIHGVTYPKSHVKPQLQIQSNVKTNQTVQPKQITRSKYLFKDLDNGNLNISKYSKLISENDLQKQIFKKYSDYYKKVHGLKTINPSLLQNNNQYKQYRKWILSHYNFKIKNQWPFDYRQGSRE